MSLYLVSKQCEVSKARHKDIRTLAKMMVKALAVEHGAYNAYDGHIVSLYLKYSDKEAQEVKEIQNDEMKHRLKLEEMINQIGTVQSPMLNRIFALIGKMVSFSCHYTGYKAPMFGAKLLETMAGVNYREMAKIAYRLNYISLAIDLEQLAASEERHEAYFASKL